jgi:phosphoenolpyruvate carboxykinase (GTP)
VTGRRTPVGILPTEDELELEGLEIQKDDLDTLLAVDVSRWRREMANREAHLAQFDGLPEEIWQAHRRIADGLEDFA